MANSQFHDNQAMLNTLYYESHKSLVERVCMALGQTEKTEEMVELLLGEKVKMKFKKDPNKPKKPKSGFLFFCDEHRPKMIDSQKKKNKKVVIGDIAKELGKKWKKLSDSQKAKYSGMNEKDKERYSKELEVYNSKIYQLSDNSGD
tara:strand:- start:478 stop:915 length:438 start_codon:yes stop_codon:yes gene_type:complete